MKLVSKQNVGGDVSRGASAPGVPHEAWQAGSGELLVVGSQGTRLLLCLGAGAADARV